MLKIPEGKLKVLRNQGYENKEITLGIRPEDIHDEPLFIQSSPETALTVNIDVVELMGAETILYSSIKSQSLIARFDSRADVKSGQSIALAFNMNKAHFFDNETSLRIC